MLFYFFFSVISSVSAQNQELDRLVTAVLEVNPELQALDEQIQAAEYNVSIQSSFQDPQLSAGISNLPMDTYSLDQEAMTQKIFSLRQSIPFAGKRGLKRDVAIAQVDLHRITKEEKKRMLIRQVKGLYFENRYLDAVNRFLSETKNILQMISDVATVKYQTGMGLKLDLLQIDLEISQLEKRKLELEQKVIGLRGSLNTLLQRSAGEDIQFSDSLRLILFAYSIEDLENIILTSNPAWKIENRYLEQYEVQEKLARRQYWPDGGIMLSYGQREERPDFFSASISVDLPVFTLSKQKPEVQRSSAAIRGQKYEIENLKITLLNKAITLRDQLQAQYEICLLYRDKMVPYAREAYSSALSAYTADRLDFASLMRSFMKLLQSEMETKQALRDYFLMMADLEVLAGKELK